MTLASLPCCLICRNRRSFWLECDGSTARSVSVSSQSSDEFSRRPARDGRGVGAPADWLQARLSTLVALELSSPPGVLAAAATMALANHFSANASSCRLLHFRPLTFLQALLLSLQHGFDYHLFCLYELLYWIYCPRHICRAGNIPGNKRKRKCPSGRERGAPNSIDTTQFDDNNSFFNCRRGPELATRSARDRDIRKEYSAALSF